MRKIFGMFSKKYDTLILFFKSIKELLYVSLQGVVFYISTSFEIDLMDKYLMCYLTDHIVLLRT